MSRARITRFLLVVAAILTAGAAAVAVAGRPDGPAPGGVVLAASPPGGGSEGRHQAGVRVIRLDSGSWLGVRIEDVTDEMAEELGIQRAEGVRITEVEKESPADKAGLREEDVIVRFDGEPVRSHQGLSRLVRETPAGRTVEVGFIRGGRRDTVRVEIEERPSRGRSFVWEGETEPFSLEMPEIEIPDLDIDIPHLRGLMISSGPRLGVHVQGLGDQLAEYFGVEEGLLVQSVIEDSPAERAGIRAGDVIVRVDGDRVEDVGDLRNALRDREGETVSVTVVRDRKERSIEVKLERTEDGKHGSKAISSAEREEIRKALAEAQAAQREARQAYRVAAEEYRARQREEMERQRELIERQREMRDAQRHQLRDLVREAARSRGTALVQI